MLHVAAAVGAMACLKYLVELPGVDLTARDSENGWTPLHRAMYHGQVSCCPLHRSRGRPSFLPSTHTHPPSLPHAHAYSCTLRLSFSSTEHRSTIFLTTMATPPLTLQPLMPVCLTERTSWPRRRPFSFKQDAVLFEPQPQYITSFAPHVHRRAWRHDRAPTKTAERNAKCAGAGGHCVHAVAVVERMVGTGCGHT
jgi:hypothetical protein